MMIPASDPSLRKLPRSIQFQGTSASITVSRSLQNKHEQRKAREADTSGKQPRRKAKKVKRRASKQQSGQQHQATPTQPVQVELVKSQSAVEQPGAVLDDEPLFQADFPLPGSLKLPTVMGAPAALARLNPTTTSAAKGLGVPPPVASSSHAKLPDAASPLAGKRRGSEGVSDTESSGVADSPRADRLAVRPFTPDDSFFCFFLGRERYIFFLFFFFWVYR